MPELPEVETTCRGIRPHLVDQQITEVVIRQSKLRWPVHADLKRVLLNQRIVSVERRAKYILVKTDVGALIIHLGMSGSLRVIDKSTRPGKHDHLDFVINQDLALRFNDPRKFGAVLWCDGDLAKHKLFAHLGPEPLSDQFDGEWLYRLSKNRKTPVKSFIMDASIVVGVGNIYASESLFLAGIDPRRQAGRISLIRYRKLAESIKGVLKRAIAQGGTTLKDFVNEQGKPGYFQQSLNVYGRAGEPCVTCRSAISQVKLAQRTSFYCSQCQR